MATSFLSTSPPISGLGIQSASHLFFFRNQNNPFVCLRKCKSQGKLFAHCSNSSIPTSEIGVCKRDFLLFGFSASLALLLPTPGIGAEEEVKMANLVDDINAYAYAYPVELPSKKLVFKWVESRKPERYSSAAPLSRKLTQSHPSPFDGIVKLSHPYFPRRKANARLRIVSERVDFRDNIIISVSIGPPNSEFLKSKEKSIWTAKAVADSVLSDKSALRVTSSQKLAESSILDAHSSEVDGERYWLYEYLVRKSPTKSVQESNNYRQYVAATAERDGYLYTLNASTLSKKWELMGPILKRTVDSFRLLPPTENYVPPYKDPWRFW